MTGYFCYQLHSTVAAWRNKSDVRRPVNLMIMNRSLPPSGVGLIRYSNLYVIFDYYILIQQNMRFGLLACNLLFEESGGHILETS